MNIQDDIEKQHKFKSSDSSSPFAGQETRPQTTSNVHVRVKSSSGGGGLSSKRSHSTILRSFSQHVAKPEVKEKIMVVDAYALKEKPASWAGLAISVIVLLATLVYLAFIIYQFMTAPPTQKADIYWTIGAGPFPAPIYCAAIDGCYISNAVSVAFATNVALSIDPAQTSCIFLPYQASYVINITYSTSPLDGLSVIWNGSNVDPTVPKGFGAQVNSQTNCYTPGHPSCDGGIFNMKTPIGPGFSLVTFVQTLNSTAKGAYANGQDRKEWFVGKFSNESKPISGSTPCLSTYPFLANNSDFVQSTLRQNTLYTVQTISRDSLFLVIFGTVGGAYSLFLQFGALLLILITFLISVHEKRVAEKRVAEDPQFQADSIRVGDELRSGGSQSSGGSMSSTTPLIKAGGAKAPSSSRPQSRLKNASQPDNDLSVAERERSQGGWMEP
jgi:hypothetical protein